MLHIYIGLTCASCEVSGTYVISGVVVQLVGSGSEMILDVAAGVDWTAICAIMMCVQQVSS